MALFNLEKKEEKVEEKWIWVDGYKGTNKDMTCNGYQYELGKRFDMPEDKEIVECSSGFHLCLNLSHVFGYYRIGNDNRFFKVRALVREDDVAKYIDRDAKPSFDGTFRYIPYSRTRREKDKLVAKSIEFISECTVDEIFSAFDSEEIKDWTDDDKTAALSLGVNTVAKLVEVRVLETLGYSKPFATLIVNENMYTLAYAAGSQTDLSMDMKVWLIMRIFALLNNQWLV